MLSRFGNGAIVVGCVLFGFAVSAGPGLVARAAEPERWRDRFLSRLAAPEQHGMADLPRGEAGVPDPAASTGADSPKRTLDVADERAAWIAQNEELARQNRALQRENRALAETRARTAGTCAAPDGEDAKAQLLYWAERVRNDGRGLRGGLSSTQAAALGVLLRPTRSLDPDNPWQ